MGVVSDLLVSFVGFLADAVLSVLVLLAVFVALAAATRVERAWLRIGRARYRDRLRAAGCDPADIAALEPTVRYVVAHRSVWKPVFGAAAVLSLLVLSSVATDRTFLATSYGLMALGFLALTVVELRRFRRARRLEATLMADPASLRSDDVDGP